MSSARWRMVRGSTSHVACLLWGSWNSWEKHPLMHRAQESLLVSRLKPLPLILAPLLFPQTHSCWTPVLRNVLPSLAQQHGRGTQRTPSCALSKELSPCLSPQAKPCGTLPLFTAVWTISFCCHQLLGPAHHLETRGWPLLSQTKALSSLDTFLLSR